MYRHLKKYMIFTVGAFMCSLFLVLAFTTDRKKKYKIFSVISVNKKAFPYWKFVMAQDKLDYDEFINKVKKYSFYDVGITPQYGDKIITLSTCDNDRGNDYRFVVFAVNI